MDEQEWVACDDPERMLAFLRDGGKLTDRKARLFAAACCRRVWGLLTDERSRRAVEVAERFADGDAPEAELSDARQAARLASRVVAPERRPHVAAGPKWAAWEPADFSSVHYYMALLAAYTTVRLPSEAEGERERDAQCDLLREIFPFRPPPIAASCRTPSVISLAGSIYDGRLLPSGHLDPHRLSVLADALEDADCTDRDVLGHLRDHGAVHVRGCFLLDFLIGKS